MFGAADTYDEILESALNLQVVYCSHQGSDLTLREKLAISEEEKVRAYDHLRSQFPDSEFVVLSTCNRVELYTAQESKENIPTHQQLAGFFADFHAIPVDEFFDNLLERTGADAVRHLFSVASGVDSMVVGEPQIVSQVREAYATARVNQASGPMANAMFERALKVGKRIRTETGLAEGRISIASVAVGDFGKSIFDRFDDKQVLVIGAGEMATETLRYLKEEGVRELVVVNRSVDRAQELADEWGGTYVEFDQLDRLMAMADIIVSTTGADRPIVTRDRFAAVRKQGEYKQVFILDLGAPRDFESSVGDIDDNVFLYCIDDLEETCENNRKVRKKEIAAAQKIIDEETDEFMHAVYHRATGPIIRNLREKWRDVTDEELAWLFGRLGEMDDRERKIVEQWVNRLVNKLLHPPLEALKEEAREGTPHGLMDALRRLFHLRD
ncbi:Glutamyl-tRNA reductase [Symmachiella macrocystis]|uniref:Glutamyl-tRNA reductase n=1 Tax=Symmachiella macrocystis TaxID=2527985 RepID=A0A5C6BSS3_9PLAN|nr:glutamyl-tRNA reductase [Symmachiella macrocystis]TWU13929.1 Glutamyl-tRNA reductase [Symmachiella macrocystis]